MFNTPFAAPVMPENAPVQRAQMERSLCRLLLRVTLCSGLSTLLSFMITVQGVYALCIRDVVVFSVGAFALLAMHELGHWAAFRAKQIPILCIVFIPFVGGAIIPR